MERVHRPPGSGAARRRAPARVRPDRRRSISPRAPSSAPATCCSRSIRARSRPRSIACARSSRAPAPRSAAPPRSAIARSGWRPRTPCRPRSTIGARRPRSKPRPRWRPVEASLRAAELNLEFTRVVAPIGGRVGRAIVTEGNLVSSGPGEATLLATLVSLDPIYAAFDVDEQSFLAFSAAPAGRGAPAAPGPAPSAWRWPAKTGSRTTGRLQFLDNQLDPATGTIRVRAVFANADGALTPGLFVRLRMSGRPRLSGRPRPGPGGRHRSRQALRLRRRRRQDVAYRPVTLGPIVDGLRVVRSGLQPDEVVLVNGLQRVRPGATVARGTWSRWSVPSELRPLLHRPADLRRRPVAGDHRWPAPWRWSSCRSASTRAWCRRPWSCAAPIRAPTRRSSPRPSPRRSNSR